MAAIVKYYGEYENNYVKKMVIGYLERKIKNTEYKNLLQVIYSYHKANFGSPCIATIKDCIDKARLKDNRYEPYIVSTTKNVWDYKRQQETNKELKEVDPELFKKLKEKVNMRGTNGNTKN